MFVINIEIYLLLNEFFKILELLNAALKIIECNIRIKRTIEKKPQFSAAFSFENYVHSIHLGDNFAGLFHPFLAFDTALEVQVLVNPNDIFIIKFRNLLKMVDAEIV